MEYNFFNQVSLLSGVEIRRVSFCVVETRGSQKKMDDIFNAAPEAFVNVGGVPNVDQECELPTPNEGQTDAEVLLLGSVGETDPEADPQACFIKKEGGRRKGVLWPALEKQEGMRTIYPFLDRDNCDRDYQLCSVLAMQQVFLSSHGSKSKVWEEVRTILCGMRTKDNELLFPDGISNINTLRRRTGALLQWIKKHRDSAAFRSGTDDEVHSEFIELLENLLEQKESAEEEAAEKAAETTKANKQKASEAEVLRLSAMSTAAGRKRLEEVLVETGFKKKNAPKSPSPSSLSNVSTSTEPITEVASLTLMMKDERKFQEEKWEKRMEMRRLEAKEKLEMKRKLAEEKAARREEELQFRRELKLAKLQKHDDSSEGQKETNSKGLQNAIYALIQSQEQRFNKMEEILQKIADK